MMADTFLATLRQSLIEFDQRLTILESAMRAHLAMHEKADINDRLTDLERLGGLFNESLKELEERHDESPREAALRREATERR